MSTNPTDQMIPALPTADQIEAFAPELWALADRYAEDTLQTDIDFDLEIFDAIDMLLRGEPETVVLSQISLEHPGAAEATTTLRQLVSERAA